MLIQRTLRPLLRCIGAYAAIGLVVACGPTPGVKNVGSAAGYSVSYVDASPRPATELLVGQTVPLAVTVKYALERSGSGQILLLFEDEANRPLWPHRRVVSESVTKGTGRATLADQITVPDGIRELHVYIPLVPAGLRDTEGELKLVYPVRSERRSAHNE